jgi:hypothetical protein
MLVPNPDSASLTPIRLVIGYFISNIENGVSYGGVKQVQGFCDLEGNRRFVSSITRKGEPGLVRPRVDPIDFVGDLPLRFAKLGAAALFETVIRVLEKDASVELTEIAGSRTIRSMELYTAEDLARIKGGMPARPGGEPRPFTPEQLNKPIPLARKVRSDGRPIQLQGAGRRLNATERANALQVFGAIKKVSETEAATARDIMKAIKAELPLKRVKMMERPPYSTEGWVEIDVLDDNPGAMNVMRVIYKVKNDAWEVKIIQMH